MSKSQTWFSHHMGRLMFFFYARKEDAKIFLIKAFKGEQAKKDYILSQVKVPVTFYMHMEITELAKRLNVDPLTLNLFVDIHHLGHGRMDDLEQRTITLAYWERYQELERGRATREWTLECLVKSGDLTQRMVEFRRYEIDQWLAGAKDPQ